MRSVWPCRCVCVFALCSTFQISNVGFTTTDRSGFLPAPIGMNFSDLECPIRLKVRLVDGTLDIRLLRVSDSTHTHRCSQRQRRGSGLEGLAPLHVSS